MASEKNLANQRSAVVPPWVFSGLFGAFLGLALLKFGNPPIMEKFIEPPTNLTEWIIMSWPVEVGYWLLGVMVVVGVCSAANRCAEMGAGAASALLAWCRPGDTHGRGDDQGDVETLRGVRRLLLHGGILFEPR
jgi:hypothetical protein